MLPPGRPPNHEATNVGYYFSLKLLFLTECLPKISVRRRIQNSTLTRKPANYPKKEKILEI